MQLFSHGYSDSTKKARADGGLVGGEWIVEIPGGTKGESSVIGRTANAHRHGFTCV